LNQNERKREEVQEEHRVRCADDSAGHPECLPASLLAVFHFAIIPGREDWQKEANANRIKIQWFESISIARTWLAINVQLLMWGVIVTGGVMALALVCRILGVNIGSE